VANRRQVSCYVASVAKNAPECVQGVRSGPAALTSGASRCRALRVSEDSAKSGTCAWQSAASVLGALFWGCMMIYHAHAPVYGRAGAAHQSLLMAPFLVGGQEQGRGVGARRSRQCARPDCRARAHVSGRPCGRGYRRPVNKRDLIGAGERRSVCACASRGAQRHRGTLWELSEHIFSGCARFPRCFCVVPRCFYVAHMLHVIVHDAYRVCEPICCMSWYMMHIGPANPYAACPST
jgi:hypothetical protein